MGFLKISMYLIYVYTQPNQNYHRENHISQFPLFLPIFAFLFFILLKNDTMDHIVGDDIAIGIRQVVRQLLNLASDPDSQVLMARQPGISYIL